MIGIKRKAGIISSSIVTVQDIPLIKFPIIENTGIVKHGFSTRFGGVSEGIFFSMNLSFTRGDNPECVTENYKRISNAIGFDYRDIVMSDQTHSTNIRIVSNLDKGKGITKEKDFKEVDGLVTNVPGIPLVTLFADCVPLYFVDPVKKVIGLSHSGWKGTLNKIGNRTVEVMHETYGCKPSDIVACVGPSICQDCYEVGEDVAERFIGQYSTSKINKILYKKNSDKYQLNLWKANEISLLEAGIQPYNLALPDICTCCNKDILFSHRGLQGKRGNLGAFLMLKNLD